MLLSYVKEPSYYTQWKPDNTMDFQEILDAEEIML